MQIASVAGEARELGGRHANDRLRRRGMIPGIVYGHGETPENVAVSLHDLEQALHRMQHVIKLNIAGAETPFLIKQVQYDHLQRTPLHVDLMRVDLNERVRGIKVGLEFKGTPVGVRAGGVLTTVITDVEIECLLTEIPEVIRVNIDNLGLGEAIHVRELELPPGVKAMAAPDATVIAVRHKKTDEPIAAAAEGEAAAEPEVIGRVAKEVPGEGDAKAKEKEKK